MYNNYINYQTILKLLFVCVLTATTEAGNTCPTAEISFPCICSIGTSSSNIICPEETSSLKPIFKRISEALKNEDKKFGTMQIYYTGITELEEEVFSDITFERLVITGESRLTRIHVNAFKSSTNDLKEINIWQSNITTFDGDYNALKAFGSLINLERLYFPLNGPTNIPDNAFITPNGIQPKLREISLINSGIYSIVRSIGNYAFYYITGLTNLELNSYQIEHISRHAFDFFQSSSERLFISLNNNHLNATSFETETFLHAKRPITLYLGSNRIEYLDENIFLAFLLTDNRNYLILGIENPVKCDCKMFWLYLRKSSLESQVGDFECDDGIMFWSKDFSDFDQCYGS